MMIVPRVSLKRVRLFGVEMVMDIEDVRDFKASYPDAVVSKYRQGRSLPRPDQLPSGVVNIDPREYQRQCA